MKCKNKIRQSLDRRIRISLAYTNWVMRNKSSLCLHCNTSEHLECHHLINLYHVIMGVYDYYGDEEATFKHIIMYHERDMLEGVTLCQTCHQKYHPGLKFVYSDIPINTDMWSTIPRMLKIKPNHSVQQQPGTINLITYQTLLGIGWYIMNDHMDSKIIKFNRRRLAKLIGKKAGTSFNKSLEVALKQLECENIVYGWYKDKNEIEIHISQSYIDDLKTNPWFIPMVDVKTNSMCVLCLRIFLGMQSRKKKYGIGLDKLKKHIGMTVKNKSSAIAAINKSLEHIPWARMEVSTCLQFYISGKPPTPIRSLRTALIDALTKSG